MWTVTWLKIKFIVTRSVRRIHFQNFFGLVLTQKKNHGKPLSPWIWADNTSLPLYWMGIFTSQVVFKKETVSNPIQSNCTIQKPTSGRMLLQRINVTEALRWSLSMDFYIQWVGSSARLKDLILTKTPGKRYVIGIVNDEWIAKRFRVFFLAFQIGYYDLNSLVASLVESKGRLFAITRMGVFHKVNIFDREFRRNASLSGSNRCKFTCNPLGGPNYEAAGGQYFLFHV